MCQREREFVVYQIGIHPLCVCVLCVHRQVRTCDGEMIVLCESGESSGEATCTVATSTSVNAGSNQTHTRIQTGAYELTAFEGFNW